MAADRWNRIKEIFAEATEREPAARAVYLDQACGGDTELRAAVDRLLRGHVDADTADIFETPRRTTLQRDEVLGGRFRIERFIGRGGMGEVYQATDLELGGSVALKIIRPELLEDTQFLGRFRREVQIARQVTHPNICRVFDVAYDRAGDRQRVFLTMEYLDGETLTDVLKRDGRLSEPQALPIVRQMAEGLAALHDKGIVHRDFKPGNVMIVRSGGSAPRAVVTDFGLARSTGGETSLHNLSRAGNVVGTPDYMAPEQLNGAEVTPSADIYALGLVMYEVVTGRKPFSGGQALENALQRLARDPDSPRAHVPDLSPVWESAILRCLAKEPSQRPASAASVAEMLVSPTPAPKRVMRRDWVKWPVAAAIVLALLTTVWRLKVQTGQPGAIPTDRQHLAVLPLTVVGGDSDLRVFADGLMETVTSRLSQFEGPNAGLLVVPASEVRQQAAKTAGDAAKKFGVNAAVEGSIQSQGERVRLVLTLIDARAMRQSETIVVEDQKANALSLQDAAVAKLANALSLRVRPEHARETRELSPGAYEFYLTARGFLQRNDKLASVENAITLFRRALEIDPKYALAHSGLGEAYWFKYEQTRDSIWVEEALRSCRRALELNASLPEAQITIGRVHLGTSRFEEARQEFEKALTVDGRSAEAYQGLANAYAGLQQFEKAEATYQKAISLRPADWTGYKQLGVFYFGRGEFQKALEQYEKVVALTPDNAQGYVNMGVCQVRLDNFEAAEKSWLRALELDPNRVSTVMNLAKLQFELGRFKESIELYQKALKLGNRSYRLWGNLGSAYKRVGEEEKSMESFDKAMKQIQSELLVNPKNAELQSYMAFYGALSGRGMAIEPMLKRSVELAPDNIDVLVRVAEAYAVLGKLETATALVRKSLDLGASKATLQRSFYLREVLKTLGV